MKRKRSSIFPSIIRIVALLLLVFYVYFVSVVLHPKLRSLALQGEMPIFEADVIANLSSRDWLPSDYWENLIYDEIPLSRKGFSFSYDIHHKYVGLYVGGFLFKGVWDFHNLPDMHFSDFEGQIRFVIIGNHQEMIYFKGRPKASRMYLGQRVDKEPPFIHFQDPKMIFFQYEIPRSLAGVPLRVEFELQEGDQDFEEKYGPVYFFIQKDLPPKS